MCPTCIIPHRDRVLEAHPNRDYVVDHLPSNVGSITQYDLHKNYNQDLPSPKRKP